MSHKGWRRSGQPATGRAKAESINAPPITEHVLQGEDEEPLSHLRQRVFQPIRARIYRRLNRFVDRLGYVPALLLLLVVTGASTLGITYWNSPEKVRQAANVVRFYFVARAPSRPRYLDDQEMIRELDTQLAEDAAPSNRVRSDLGYIAWTEAQLVIALQGRAMFDAADLVPWFRRDAGACHCWRGGNSNRDSFAATAWVLLAFSRMQAKPTPQEIEFLLANQHRPGWWQVYPAENTAAGSPLEDSENASTYTTSFVILALQELLQRGLIPDAQEQRVQDAISKGRNWLLSTTVPGSAGRWKDYPNGTDGRVSIGISGIALHALHRTPGPPPTANDADWMGRLPTTLPPPGDVAVSGQGVQVSLGKWIPDSTHMFAFPWALIGTVDAYPQGTLAQRVQALKLFGEIPAQQDAVRSEMRREPWAAAEFLIGLRYARGDDVL